MTWKRIYVGVCLLFLSVLAGLFLFAWSGGVINTTGSLPNGIYWRVKTPVNKGAIVVYQPPAASPFSEAIARGYFADKLIKKVVAVAGDTISVTPKGIIVNGRSIPNTEPIRVDPKQRPMPVLRLNDYRLEEGEMLLASDYNRYSYDSRYFGVVNAKDVVSVIVPVWMF